MHSSGSWPGEIFLFRGKGNGQYGPPEKLKDKDGNVINVGGGVRETADSITITGDAALKEDKDGRYVEYNGKTYRQTAAKQVLVTGCASSVAVADWNGDSIAVSKLKEIPQDDLQALYEEKTFVQSYRLSDIDDYKSVL